MQNHAFMPNHFFMPNKCDSIAEIFFLLPLTALRIQFLIWSLCCYTINPCAAAQRALMLTAGEILPFQILGGFPPHNLPQIGSNKLLALSYVFTHYWSKIQLRQRFDLTFNHNSDPNFRYFCLGWIPELYLEFHPVFFTIGLGPSIKNKPTHQNGGYFLTQAAASMGVSLKPTYPIHFEVFVRHASNFYTAEPNHGSDYVGLTVAWNF